MGPLLSGLFGGNLHDLDDAATDLMVDAPYYFQRVVAEHYQLPFAAVDEVLWSLSDDAWRLLNTPEGWTRLGEHIAITLHGDFTGPPLPVTVH